MSDYPDLNQYGYQIDNQLGSNREGGRIAWKGKQLKTNKTVVIKQFCFAKTNTNWSGYQAYERELKVLQALDCMGIPQYLDGIETENGFCLIQEYIDGATLSNYRPLTLTEIKEIVIKILDILIYLQQQNPPIIHRDIKPENIILDEKLKVYLIDFGFASLGSKEVSGSSVFKGTPGFIAPEQIIQPTLASDLYSLGITLVCLLGNKNIAEIRQAISPDDPYQLNIKPLLPHLNRQLINWLEKMTKAKASKRFPNALTAKDALLKIDWEATPGAIALYDRQSNEDNHLLVKPKVVLGAVAIATLSTVGIWGIGYIDHQLESTLVNIAIAIMAAIVITITELGAIEIAKIDPQAKLQGGILGIGVPILLVIASSFIWGMGEAVDISAMVAIAEIFTLSYFWWNIPLWKNKLVRVKTGIWFGAIALGTIVGLRLI